MREKNIHIRRANKVGIITFHFLENYGTLLQAYALHYKINSLGYNSEFIDYRLNDRLPNCYQLITIRLKGLYRYMRNISKYFKLFRNRNNIKRRSRLFKLFIQNNLIMSATQYRSVKELKDTPPLYDIYLVGSDQTWNLNLSSSSEAYFLSFALSSGITGSYAPSIGTTKITDIQRDQLKKWLKNIKFISCREETGAKLIQNIIGKKVSHVVDPTFLLNADEWDKIAILPQISKPYILCYFLGENDFCREFAEKIRLKYNYHIVFLPMCYLDMSSTDSQLFDVGPKEFLGLIREAKIICTDSFHGTVFSIIYKKNFLSFTKRKDSELTSDNSRIYDLLKMTQLGSRLITNECNIDDLQIEINYELTNSLLENKINDSVDYLNNLLIGL